MFKNIAFRSLKSKFECIVKYMSGGVAFDGARVKPQGDFVGYCFQSGVFTRIIIFQFISLRWPQIVVK
jgi:hypothetical protein